MRSPQQSQLPDGSVELSNMTIYYSPFSSFAMTMTIIIFFSSHVFKYEEGGIAITSYDLLFELTKI
jgi:hypothetical protein